MALWCILLAGVEEHGPHPRAVGDTGATDPNATTKQTCYRRFQRWIEEGVLSSVLEALAGHLEERGDVRSNSLLVAPGTAYPDLPYLGELAEKYLRQQREEFRGGRSLRRSAWLPPESSLLSCGRWS